MREGEGAHEKGVEGEATDGKTAMGEVREGEEIHEKGVKGEKGIDGKGERRGSIS